MEDIGQLMRAFVKMKLMMGVIVVIDVHYFRFNSGNNGITNAGIALYLGI
jgi:hypothetical protein